MPFGRSSDDYTQFQEVQLLLDADPLNRRVVDIFRRQSSANGWSIAKMLDEDPNKVSVVLAKLRQGGLIDSESGSGLDGYYFLTRLAYRLVPTAS